MKILKRILFVALTFIAMSCDSDESLINENNENALLKLTDIEISSLKETISESYSDRDIQVSKIVGNRKIGRFEVITFLNQTGEEMEIGIENLFNDDGTLSKIPEPTVYCSGTCDCHLEGIFDLEDDSNSYVQCSCSECQMHLDVKTANGNVIKESKLLDFAKTSYLETFTRQPTELVISKVMSNKYEKANVLTVYYNDNDGNESTFLLITNYRYKNGNLNDVSSGQKDIGDGDSFIIDCTGTCDCRERFFPASGDTECTCSPCKMKVTPIEEIEGGGLQ